MGKHKRNINTLAERDGGHRCVYCGWEKDDEYDWDWPFLTVDHVIPKFHGGPNIIENKVIACNMCNVKKGNRLLLATGMRVRWGIYASDNPQESQEKVLAAIGQAA